MRSLLRRRLVIGIAIVAILGAAVAYFLYENPCSDVFPCHDSPNVVAMEEREVLGMSRNFFYKVKSAGQLSFTDRLPMPLGVHISGYNATLTTDGPLYAGSLVYAQVWYDVYHKYHRGAGTVYMRVAWKSGSVSQKFPLSEF